MSDVAPEYRYVAVRDLALTFLERNRVAQARIVDNMLVARDEQISQMLTELSRRAAAIERYMHENAELRGFIGVLRTCLGGILAEVNDLTRQALERPIPAPPRKGAKESL